MINKALVCTLSLVLLVLSTTVQAQDPCQKFHDRYRVCVEKQGTGRNMDYDACKGYADQYACEGVGCYWYAEKGNCIIQAVDLKLSHNFFYV